MSDVQTDLSAPKEPAGPDEDPKVFNPEQTLAGKIQKNFFKNPQNSIISIVFLVVFAYVAYRVGRFLFFNQKLDADGDLVSGWRILSFQGQEGAPTVLEIFMIGTRLTRDTAVAGFLGDGPIQLWMIWVSIYLTAFSLGFAIGRPADAEIHPMKTSTRVSIFGPVILAAVVLILLTDTVTPKILTLLVPLPVYVGMELPKRLSESVLHRKGLILFGLVLVIFLFETGFNPINVDRFGGLLLTINSAFIAIALCFPIGILMALTRRSSFPLLRPIAVTYIELIRGVPLISLLFMGQFAIGFFLPSSVQDSAVVRSDIFKAIFMMTIFSGAYVAEIVRGGLQSVADGQTEAGQAVGLSPVTITRRIVLPQALRNSIPALVGQFIALLKDTTLLVIIGIFDLLGVSDPILANPEFTNQGYQPEVYAFVGFLFWVMTFSMSRASQRLESNLGVGTR